MKNLHVIPTDKPSKLFKANQKLVFDNTNDPIKCISAQHIYITSDEEVKEGDWFMSDFNSFPIHNIKDLSEREGSLGWKQKDLKNNLKIILTTDQDLIKDGVQQIDDEFLEWFVKNPSREEVEVKKYKGSHLDCANTFGQCDCGLSPCKQMYFTYETIIQSEESKQKDEKGRLMTYWGGLEQSKQVTLKEVALNYAKKEIKDRGTESDILICSIDFIAGAEYQAKQMYSEEEVIELLTKRCKHFGTSVSPFDKLLLKQDLEWFNEFKKL